MALWIRDEKPYSLTIPGQTEQGNVKITGVMDYHRLERPKILLEDLFDNRGPSVTDAPIRDACINSLSSLMKFDPTDVDWYSRDKQGNLMSVSIGYENRKMENPEYTRLLNNGEFTQHNKDEEKKFFPDITVRDLKTSMQPSTPEQKSDLAQAFQQGRENSAVREENQDRTGVQMGGREYDLSYEQFHRHDRQSMG